MHDIRYNDVNDEIIVPNPFSNAILVFKGGANGQEAPIRIIQGAKTLLDGPDRLDIDTVHREIFVPDGGRVLVYPLDGNGDVAPLRVIEGPDTQIAGQSLAVDPLNNLIAVTGRDRSIVIFNRTANGNVKPLRVIKGDATQIDRINQMAIYPQGKLLVVAMRPVPILRQRNLQAEIPVKIIMNPFQESQRDRLAGRPSRFPLQQLTLKKMTTPGQPATGTALRGLGWDIESPFSSNRGELFPVGSFGHTGFTGTSIWIDPDRDRYFVLLTNRVCGGGTIDQMREVRRDFHDAVS